MRQTVTESCPVVITEALDAKTGIFELQIISPGIGSSGAYPADVLEAAGRDGVFAKGTHLYLDHPTESERVERPERSVRDLAGALTENARWNGEALVAKARVYSTYRPLLQEAAQDIGMSIRAAATIVEGEYEGQTMPVIQQIHEALSVDFVTHAGRGGAVLAVLESARAREAGRLDSDRQEQFRQAVRDAHGSDSGDVWVRDFDDTDVYFERYGEDAGTFRQAYSEDDDGITLTGDPVAVTARTTYVPADAAESAPLDLAREAALARVREARNIGQWIESRLHLSLTQLADEMFGDGRLTREERIALSGAVGDGLTAFTAALEQSAPQLYARDLWAEPEQVAAAATESVPVLPAGQPITQESEEDTMPQDETAYKRQLEEATGRVHTLESERDQAVQRATAAEAERDQLRESVDGARARDIATAAASEAGVQLDEYQLAGITAGYPRTSEGRIDEAAFTTRASEAVAKLAEAGGAGTVRGVGHTTSTGGQEPVSEADFDALDDAVFGEIKEA